jgi:type VI secretion system protein ImpL
MITALTSNNSPLLRLLNTIRVNTSLAPIVLASPKLQSLNVLLASADNSKSNALYGIFVSLHELHTYLENLLKMPAMEEAIFQATVQRMKNSTNDPITHIYLMAVQSPQPMKTWLNMIATKSWYFMLQESSQYIENAWQKNVLSVFRDKIACYYPFSPTAIQSVNVQQFSDFFKPQGVLTNFYSDYLQPFVDDTQEKLQWRAVNDQKPLFSSTILDQLERAAHLQQLFFPKGDDKLNVQALGYLSRTDKGENVESPINFAQIKLPDQLAS